MIKYTYINEMPCDDCGKIIDGTPETCYCEHEECVCLNCMDKRDAKNDIDIEE